MSLISDILGSSIKDKIFDGTNLSKVSSQKNTSAFTKIIGKNFMSMSSLARDMNVASQNVKKLVEIMGDKPSSKEDKVASSGLTEDERERKLQVLIEQETKVTPIPKEERKEEKKPGLASKAFEKLKSTKIGKKATSKIADLKKSFSPANIFKSLSKYLAIGALIGVIFVAFKDSFMEWVSGLWETIKESFGEFVEGIKKWFTEVIQPILDKIGNFIDEWVVQPIKNFFNGFVKFIKGYFEFMSNLITNPLETIKSVWEKFKAVVDGVIDKVANYYARLKEPLKSVADALLPESIKKALQERVKAKKEAAVVDDSAEKKKLERQQAAPKIEADETARVRKLEEEKGYKGDDEIVRARLGLPPKTETMKKEEAKVAPAAPAAPPTVTPTPAPAPAKPAAPPVAPAPAPAKPAAPPVAPTPAPAPAPAPAKPAPSPATPPTATPAQAEIKAPAGGLSGVTTIQSGVDVSGLKPDFEKRVAAMAADFKAKTGKPLLITSGFRSNEKQKELFDKKVAELGGNVAAAKQMVAEPMPPLGNGKGSFHLKGLAIDINSKGPAGLNALAGPRTASTGWLESFGLMRPVKNEDWHIQPSGTPPTADNPVKPGAPTLVADKDGKPIEVNTGKKESIGPAAAPPSSGTQVAAASTDVAAGQRQQQKPQTPVVVNAPTNNTTVVNKTQVASTATRQDTGRMLAGAAA